MKKSTLCFTLLMVVLITFAGVKAYGGRPKKHRPMKEVHVCVMQPDQTMDHVVYMSEEPLTPIPSTRHMNSIRGAIYGLGQQRQSPDILTAASFITYHLEPVRIPFPPTPGSWGDEGPRPPRIAPPPTDTPPVTGYDCLCGTSVYDSSKHFKACMVGGCSGCMICTPK